MAETKTDIWPPLKRRMQFSEHLNYWWTSAKLETEKFQRYFYLNIFILYERVKWLETWNTKKIKVALKSKLFYENNMWIRTRNQIIRFPVQTSRPTIRQLWTIQELDKSGFRMFTVLAIATLLAIEARLAVKTI
jgi:hypothetical protein